MKKLKSIILCCVAAVLLVLAGTVAFGYYRYVSSDYRILVDFSIPSTADRFFVYDADGALVFKCRCAHGPGMGSTPQVPVFSNRIGSECSSLGRYIICRKKESRKFPGGSVGLIGLSPTNYNAWRRGILIHGGLRNYPSFVPMNPKISAGCFCIPTSRMRQLLDLLGDEGTFSLKAFV